MNMISSVLSRTRLACLKHHLYLRWRQSCRCYQTDPIQRQRPQFTWDQIYEPVIGLEVHAQIQSQSKLFSSAPTGFVSRPNCQVAPFDLSLPGTLPILNRLCVETAIRTGLALDCKIPLKSSFDRKHYFYGDTPNGYQITQQREPIAILGHIDFIVYDEILEGDKYVHHTPYIKRCGLKQIQLEQDSGKSLQDSEGNQRLIDLNRTGVALMEFVFEPELFSTFEVTSLVRELIQRLQAIEACSCRLEQGALRVDANVSLRPMGSQELGTRTEIKNLASFRFLRDAIDYEIQRQTKLLGSGERVINETMGYDFKTRETYVMRDKEIIQDYRFMPEPNLPPILLRDSDVESQHPEDPNLLDIAEIRKNLPVEALPQTIRAELLKPEYQLTLKQIFFLMNDSTLRQLFFHIYPEYERKNGAEIVAFLRQITRRSREDTFDAVVPEMDELSQLTTPKNWAQLINLMNSQRISPTTALDIIKLYQQKDTRSPEAIVQEYNWWLLADDAEIERICREVVEQIPKIAKKYANNGIRRPRSMLISRAQVGLGRQVSEDLLWKMFDKILLPKRTPRGMKKGIDHEKKNEEENED